ncbi:YciI family protein [Rhodovibrionaceae bacterium A322]
MFALICTDKAGALQVRLDNRPAHLAYLEKHAADLAYAGPLLGDDEKPTGSLIILNVADKAAAEAFAAADPYAEAGLFASVEIKATKMVYPQG